MRLARFDRRVWAPALALGLVLAVGASAFPYTVDDAYVIARYARRLASGAGWGLEDGAITDGVTGPLAIVPFVIAEWLGFDSIVFAKLVGLGCGAWAAALVCRAAMRHALGGPSGWLVALVAGSGATLGIWSVAGLETGMATLAATTASLSTISRPRPHGVGLGVSIAALAWLRPEAAVLAAALLSACAARDKRQALVALGLAILGALSVMGFRMALFGSALPLAWDAKPGEFDRGFFYVLRALIVCTGLFSGVVLAIAAARKSRILRALSIALSLHLAAVLLVGGDWMPGFRLLAPIIPSYALLAGLGGARALALWRGERKRVAMLLLVCAIGVPAVDALVQVPRARDAGRTREAVGHELARSIAELAGTTPVALVDVGFLPWIGGFRTLDLGGITDPAIGRLSGAHLAKPISPELLSVRGVSVIVLRSFVAPRIGPNDELTWMSAEPVEERLARAPWVHEHFRVAQVVAWSDSYFYVIMVRR